MIRLLADHGRADIDATVVQARAARLTAEEKATLRGGGTPEGWSPAHEAQIDQDAALGGLLTAAPSGIGSSAC